VTKDNEYYAYFTVSGEFDPHEITASIGLKPTDYWRKGDRNEKTHLERKFSRWSLYSRLDPSASLENHLKDVVEQLEPVNTAILSLPAELKGNVQLVGYFHSDFPGLVFESTVISRLAALNLGFDCDFYYMYSDKREDS
jgi:hypothetical protein